MATYKAKNSARLAEATMSTRTTSTYQDPRYLQMWLVFAWPKPTDRVPVACGECGWRGRRCRRAATGRSWPSCGGTVVVGRAGARQAVTPRIGRDNVMSLRDRKTGHRAGGERPARRMVTGRQAGSR